MQNVGNAISKYLFPALLIMIGLILLITSFEQNNLFKQGGFAIFAVGVLSILFINGIISRKIQIIVSVVVAIGSVYFGVMDYMVVKERLDYEKKVKLVEVHVVQRLKDIRKAQLAHLKEHGYYANSFDSLQYFLKDGRLSIVKKLGALPDTVPTEEMARSLGIIAERPEGWTDEQVIAAGLIVRDTVQVEVLGYVFNESDRRTRKTPFYVDSLPYVPFAKHRFELKSDIVEISGVKQAVFKAWDPLPFAKGYEVGSLVEASTAGNWND